MHTRPLLLIAAIALAACGGRDAGDAAKAADTANANAERPAPPVTEGAMTDPTTARYAPDLNVDMSQMRRTPGGAYVRDLVVGTGASADSGKAASIHYDGRLAQNGTRFDANQAPAAPFTFRLFSGEVVPGFDEGVSGMKAGGRRQVIIPPSLGYGPNDYGPIPGNSILVFTIEVVGVR